mgnify:CR=1 FL=1
MAKHQGMREFSAEEISGVALGQNGFKILSNVDYICGGDFLPDGETATGGNSINYFVALKVVDADAEVEARSITDGDDLTTNSGVFDGSSAVSLVNGDIIYGAFNRVEVASASHFVIAYIGR